MKKTESAKKLTLNREVIRELRELDDRELKDAAGGVTPITGLCAYTLYVQCITR